MKKFTIALALLVSTVVYGFANPLIISSTSTYSTLLLKYEESVKIKLILGNKSYDMQSYTLTYSRIENLKNDATNSNIFSPYQKSTLNLNLKSTKIDQELLDWILSPDQQTKDGQIIVTDADSGKILKTIKFTGANTAVYNENNNTNGYMNNNLYTSFSLYYKNITIKY